VHDRAHYELVLSKVQEGGYMSQNEQAQLSIDLAYPLALASYDVVQKRLEVVEKRLQEVLGFALTISLGVVALFANKGFSFRSPLFIAAMGFGLIGLVVGVIARLYGKLILIKPAVLSEKYLVLPEPEFKRMFVHFAGEHWDKNVQLVNRKGTLTNIAVVCFALEVILLSVWVAWM
jgi:hypothetical protein